MGRERADPLSTNPGSRDRVILIKGVENVKTPLVWRVPTVAPRPQGSGLVLLVG